ncbi:MAG: M6 family metalloprotease domain-containing protein [Candidatus Hydrogenedentota bacterium]|nr:MAG: M6 family metalloprotease domain-containing protein [Candidatus Hydrogenedentota bacterium]
MFKRLVQFFGVSMFFYSFVVFSVPVPTEVKAVKKKTGISEETVEKVKPKTEKSSMTGRMRKVRDIEKIPPLSAAAPLPEKGLFGKHKTLVVMVEFNDRKFPPDKGIEYYKKLFFAKRGKSVYTYYREVSYGRYEITGDVYGIIKLPYSVSQFRYKPGQSYARNRMGTLIKEIAKRIRGKIPLAQYDLYNAAGEKKPDGVIDHFGIVYPGTFEDIWPHRWGGGASFATVDGYEIRGYYIQPTNAPLGTIVHEFGHDIGLPDLYDTDYSSYGIGNWGCMAGGSWADGGNTPVHLSAWAKIKMGWISPKIVTKSGTYKVKNATRTPYALKIPVGSVSSKEYFLIENREKWGYDKFLPRPGIIVWHVNENQDSNRDERRKLLDVVEASPDGDLDKPWGQHRPTWTHTFYKSGVNFINDNTVPSTRLSNGRPSGIEIKILSEPGDVMKVKIKRPKIFDPGGPVTSVDYDNYKMGAFYYLAFGRGQEPAVRFEAHSPTVFELSALVYYTGNFRNSDRFKFRVYSAEKSGSDYVPGRKVYESPWLRPDVNTSKRYKMVHHTIRKEKGIQPGNVFFVSFVPKNTRPELAITFTRPGSGHSYVVSASEVRRMPNDNFIIRATLAAKGKAPKANLATRNDRVVQKMFKAKRLRDRKRYRQAFLMYKDVLQKMSKEKYKYQEWIPVAVTGLGVLAYRLRYYDDAIYAFKIGLEMAEYAKAKKQMAILHENLGESYYHKEDYEKAKEHLEKSLALKNELNIGGQLLTESYVWLGRTYKALGDKSKAAEYLKKGLELAKQENDTEHIEMASAALKGL